MLFVLVGTVMSGLNYGAKFGGNGWYVLFWACADSSTRQGDKCCQGLCSMNVLPMHQRTAFNSVSSFELFQYNSPVG